MCRAAGYRILISQGHVNGACSAFRNQPIQTLATVRADQPLGERVRLQAVPSVFSRWDLDP